MRRRAAAALPLLGLLAGCGLLRRTPKPAAAPAHATLGGPYQLGGVWYYPRYQAGYEATGLAAVIADHEGPTADGEAFDPTVLAASHRTLQLPAVALVTNLENGRSVRVRLNDRGPANPGRLLGLTRHAADLLGAGDGTQIYVELDAGLTATLTSQVGGGPRLDVAAAPRAAVTAEELPPPSGARPSGRGRAISLPAPDAAAAVPLVPDRLPDQVTVRPPAPGAIMLLASEFGRTDYANRQAERLAGLGASVERLVDGRNVRYRVRAGPFATVAAADAALDQARRAGILDSRLVVE